MAIRDALTSVIEAEKRGFESAWVVESSLNPGKDAVSYLGALAVSTGHIQLATGIINIFSRSATLIASTMATLDEISNGRMILGIGTGHVVMKPYHSVEFRDPLQRMREYVTVFRKLVGGERVDYDGKYVQIKNLKLNLQPTRKKIPVYIATVNQHLAKVAGEIADGVLFVLVSPSRVKELIQALEEGAKDAGRSFDEVDVACYLPTFQLKDTEKSMKAARQTIAGYGRSVFYRRSYRRMDYEKEAEALKEVWEKGQGFDEAITRVPERMARELLVVGTPDECLGRVDEYRRAGVKLPLIQPFYLQSDLDSNVRPCIETFGT